MVIIITAHPHINKIITSRCRMWIALMLLGLFLIDWTTEQSEQFVTYRFLCKNIAKVTQIDTLWHKTRWNQVKCARLATKLCIWLSWLEPNFQWRLNFQFFFSGSGHPWLKDSMKITIIVFVTGNYIQLNRSCSSRKLCLLMSRISFFRYPRTTK